MKSCGCYLGVTLAIVSAITYIVDIYVNYAMSTGHRKNDFKTISDQYMTEIMPSTWTFMVWLVIYGLLIVWYIYAFYLLLRQLYSQRNKSPLFPGIFWLVFIIINVLNGTWVYVFLHHYMITSGIILLVLTLMLYLLNIMAYRICWIDVTIGNVKKDNNDEYSNNDDVVELSSCEATLLRILTLNILPLYATWCSIATCAQWTIIFQYFTFHLSGGVSSIITLSVLSALLLIYWQMDLKTKREYFIYTYSTYILLIVAFSSILSRNHSIGNHQKPGVLFVFILLIISGFLGMVKLFSLCLCPVKSNSTFSRV